MQKEQWKGQNLGWPDPKECGYGPDDFEPVPQEDIDLFEGSDDSVDK